MYRDKVDKNLINYIEKNIIPQYENLDLAHRSSHVYDVISSSFIIAKDYNINYDIVYTVASFHDLGLIKDRKTHHIIGGKMALEDCYLNKHFNKDELNLIKEAIEDHRASAKEKPRSIYGLIVSEADMYESALKIIERTILFRINKDYNINFDNLFYEVKFHINDKYGYNGYLKSHLNSKRVKEMLSDLRYYLDNEDKLKNICFTIYNNFKFR